MKGENIEARNIDRLTAVNCFNTYYFMLKQVLFKLKNVLKVICLILPTYSISLKEIARFNIVMLILSFRKII